jgi:hypothetical protein
VCEKVFAGRWLWGKACKMVVYGDVYAGRWLWVERSAGWFCVEKMFPLRLLCAKRCLLN